MKENKIITESFEKHSDILNKTLERHLGNIAQAAEMILNSVDCGGKLVIFGNGGSAADAQHIAAEFVGKFLKDRRGLPAIALTTDTSVITALGNDLGYGRIFERQVEALVRSNDVVIGISTSGKSENVIKGLRAAKRMYATTIALTGEDGYDLKDIADLLIDIPSKETPRIQEMHLLVGHVISNIVENNLL